MYAIVEERRASAPASRTARELADVYEVSTRTIERDILALQEGGVPLWSSTGRRGGAMGIRGRSGWSALLYRWTRSAIRRVAQSVIRIDHLDGDSVATQREVKPMGVVALDNDWYLVGWCRLRDDARSFRLDRVQSAVSTGESAPNRDPERFLDIPPLIQRTGPLD